MSWVILLSLLLTKNLFIVEWSPGNPHLRTVLDVPNRPFTTTATSPQVRWPHLKHRGINFLNKKISTNSSRVQLSTKWPKKNTSPPSLPRPSTTATKDPTWRKIKIHTYNRSNPERDRLVCQHRRAEVLRLGALLLHLIFQKTGLALFHPDSHPNHLCLHQLQGHRPEQLQLILFLLSHQIHSRYFLFLFRELFGVYHH